MTRSAASLHFFKESSTRAAVYLLVVVLLAGAAFVGALVAILEIAVVECEGYVDLESPRKTLCDAPHGLLVAPPPIVVCLGAVLAWLRDRAYYLIAACGLAAGFVGLCFLLPALFPR
jgi:hypothetical protein